MKLVGSGLPTPVTQLTRAIPRIVIFNGNPVANHELSQMCRARGFETFSAPCDANAVSLAQKIRPDVSLVDVAGEIGLGVLRKLAAIDGQTRYPVIAIGTELDRERAMQNGALYFFSLPLRGHELFAAATALIRRQSGGN